MLLNKICFKFLEVLTYLQFYLFLSLETYPMMDPNGKITTNKMMMKNKYRIEGVGYKSLKN